MLTDRLGFEVQFGHIWTALERLEADNKVVWEDSIAPGWTRLKIRHYRYRWRQRDKKTPKELSNIQRLIQWLTENKSPLTESNERVLVVKKFLIDSGAKKFSELSEHEQSIFLEINKVPTYES